MRFREMQLSEPGLDQAPVSGARKKGHHRHVAALRQLHAVQADDQRRPRPAARIFQPDPFQDHRPAVRDWRPARPFQGRRQGEPVWPLQRPVAVPADAERRLRGQDTVLAVPELSEQQRWGKSVRWGALHPSLPAGHSRPGNVVSQRPGHRPLGLRRRGHHRAQSERRCRRPGRHQPCLERAAERGPGVAPDFCPERDPTAQHVL